MRERTIKLAGQRATKDGVIVIEAGRFRTQEQNRADARARLTALVAKAAEPPPKPRKKTRPSKGAVERRLKSKAGRSTVKKLRGKVDERLSPLHGLIAASNRLQMPDFDARYRMSRNVSVENDVTIESYGAAALSGSKEI